MHTYWSELKIILLAKLLLKPEELEGQPLVLSQVTTNKYDIHGARAVTPLIELHRQGAISLTNMYFSKDYISDSRSQQPRDSSLRWLSPEQLLSHLFPKVQSGQELGVDDIAWIKGHIPSELQRYLTLEIEVHKPEAQKLFDDYLKRFMGASLSVEDPIELYDYDKQKALFRNAYKQKLSLYGNTMAIKLSEVFNRDGMPQRGRFWELIFSLQQEGLIRIAGFGHSGKYSEVSIIDGHKRTESKDEPFVSFEGAALHGNNLSIVGYAPGQISPDDHKEYSMVEALSNLPRVESAIADFTIRYDKRQKLLLVGSTEIPIRGNNQSNLCKALLCSRKDFARVWDSGEVLEKWDWRDDEIYDVEGRLLQRNKKVVHTAAIGVNSVVHKATNGKIPQLFKVDTKTVSIDPKCRDRIISR